MAKKRGRKGGSVHVKGFNYMRKGKRVHVPGYNRKKAKR